MLVRYFTGVPEARLTTFNPSHTLTATYHTTARLRFFFEVFIKLMGFGRARAVVEHVVP